MMSNTSKKRIKEDLSAFYVGKRLTEHEFFLLHILVLVSQMDHPNYPK